MPKELISEEPLIVDVYQTDNEFVIVSLLPGIKSEDIDVSISNNILTIQGVRKEDQVVQSKHYYYQECYWGSFSRSIILPTDIHPEKVKASLKRGILTVRIPRGKI